MQLTFSSNLQLKSSLIMSVVRNDVSLYVDYKWSSMTVQKVKLGISEALTEKQWFLMVKISWHVG